MKNIKNRLEDVIPGGAHTYSRGLEIYPNNIPAAFIRAKGAYTFCSENNQYLDYSMALRSVVLGYANGEVDDAVISAIRNSSTFSRPSMIELAAAELFISDIPGADMVKFAKNGSNVTTAAIKLARAATGKKIVLYPSEQPFFSFDDWFIAGTPMNHGTVNDGLAKKFSYGNIQSVQDLIKQFENEIACVILEPSTNINPCSCEESGWLPKIECCGKDNFLKQLRVLCDKHGIILIFDEMITGGRWNINGAQRYFNIIPDLSTFGKAIANGYSIAALCGKREIMELGGTRLLGMPRSFLLSSTHGAEVTSLAALIKTREIFVRENVSSHIWDFNSELTTGLNKLIGDYNLSNSIKISGNAYLPIIEYLGYANLNSNNFKYWVQEKLISKKIIMPWISTSLSHGELELKVTLETFKEIFDELVDCDELYIDGELKQIFRYNN